MKKIIALAMALCMAAVSLASCGGKYSDGGRFKKGTVEDGKYINESVGLAVKLPEGFEVQKLEDLPPVEGVTYDLLAKDANNNVICLTSQSVKKKADAAKTAEKSLEDIKEHYENGEYVVNDSKLFDCKIGGNTYRAYTIDYTVGETSFEQYAIFVMCENSVVTIAYTGKDGESEKFVKENIIEA